MTSVRPLGQMPDPHPHLTLFFAVWAALGPLTGLLLGHLLTRSWDRKRWLLDSRKQEFKELVSLMTADAVAHIHFTVDLQSSNHSRAADRIAILDELHDAALRALNDRIYIDRDLIELNVGERYMNVIEEMRDGDISESATKRVRALIHEIVERAQLG